MDDAFFVRSFKRFTNLLCNVERFLDQNRSARDAVRQGFALHQLEHQISRLVRVCDIVNRGNIWMV